MGKLNRESALNKIKSSTLWEILSLSRREPLFSLFYCIYRFLYMVCHGCFSLWSERCYQDDMTLSWVKTEKGVVGCSLVLILDNLEGKKQQIVENQEHSSQGLKHSFLCNIWAWSKLFIVQVLLQQQILLNGWALFEGVVVFCCPSFLLVAFLSVQCTLPVYFWGALLAFLFITFSYFTH